MKHREAAAAALALALGLALAGAGQAAPSGGGVRVACAADREKLCPDAKPGVLGGRLRACMKAHYADLSDSCKAAIVKMRHDRGGGSNDGSDTNSATQGQ